MSARRSHGTGSITARADTQDRETWYGSWYSNGQRVKRRLGPKRAPKSREGLTRKQAEAELRRLIATVDAAGPTGERIDVAELTRRYRGHVEARGRKHATMVAVESVSRVWLIPHLGDRTPDSVTPEDVEDLMRLMQREGCGPKTIRNYIGTLSAMYRYAMDPRRRWATGNPAAAVDLPDRPESTEIKYYSLDEVRSLVDAAVEGDYHAIDRALYLTAAMTGLRQGELVALRWMDVDWTARRVRVRRNYVLGQFGTPKSRRSSRSVPLADRVAGELDRLHQSSRFQTDDDLVFADPHTGAPLLRGALMRRFRRARKAAHLDDSRNFHSLRHCFGTRMAASGMPMRTLQELMGHRDLQTTQRYADYSPSPHEAEMVEAAFADERPDASRGATVVPFQQNPR